MTKIWEMEHRCPECLSSHVSPDRFPRRKWDHVTWKCEDCHYRGEEMEFVIGKIEKNKEV